MQKEDISRYLDIIGLEYHGSSSRPHMGRLERAAQFSPFAALTGYEDLVAEEARLVVSRPQPDPLRQEQIDKVLGFLAERLKEQPPVRIVCFVPDALKEGGSFETVEGTLKKMDPVRQVLTLSDGREILMEDLQEISSPSLPELQDG